jgi:hypothetical protein
MEDKKNACTKPEIASMRYSKGLGWFNQYGGWAVDWSISGRGTELSLLHYVHTGSDARWTRVQ